MTDIQNLIIDIYSRTPLKFVWVEIASDADVLTQFEIEGSPGQILRDPRLKIFAAAKRTQQVRHECLYHKCGRILYLISEENVPGRSFIENIQRLSSGHYKSLSAILKSIPTPEIGRYSTP